MTPIERVAEEIRKRIPYNPRRGIGSDEAKEIARAALAALAECELNDHALAAGFDAGNGQCKMIRQEFRAILHALLEPENND